MSKPFLALAFLSVVLVPCAAGAQTYALGDTLTVIQRPLLNIPALVAPGHDLEISCEAPAATTGWTAALHRGDLQIPLTVFQAVYDPTTLWWALTAVMPEVPVFDMYDLAVAADGGIQDVSRHAVKALAAIPEDFYFVHITDTHLPTYLYYYEEGALTDSTNTIGLRHITNDLNVINPAFVFITGDFLNDGEMEDYLDLHRTSRAQRQLTEFQVPVFLTAGNHDVGGWDSTPPPDGTSRRDWWRFFGWRRLDAPPPGAPWRTQDFSFDLGPLHVTGLEAYDNYDSWRLSIYGYESFIASQLTWLAQDLAAAPPGATTVLFHHYDFQNQLDLAALGVDMALWGHIHRDSGSLTTQPYDLATDNAGGANHPFRLIRNTGGMLDPRPTLSALVDGSALTVAYAPANDGTHDEVVAAIHNGYPERFEDGLLRIVMPPASGYLVTGGVLTQVDQTGPRSVCYVQADIPAAGNLTVTVAVDPGSGAGTARAPAVRLLGAHPNPFNPRTEILFELPAAADCRLTIFDLRGRQVAVLAQGPLPAGVHRRTWDGTDDVGGQLPSGVYFLGLRADGCSQTRKLTLVR